MTAVIPPALTVVVALVVVGPKDLPRLMNMAGKLKRMGSAIKVRHVAEVLAGDYATAPIAEAE